MPSTHHDTIAALSTPPGRGGIGIVRVSGPLTRAISNTVLGLIPVVRRAQLADFKDSRGTVLDQGIALFFEKPHSFTGEDVLELQGHGGPLVTDLVLNAVMEAGARIAEPGEFSQRAFLNERMDLTQAEAIADLIDASTEAAARSAQRVLKGAFSEEVHRLRTQLIELRTFVEAAIDFPDEEVDFLTEHGVGQRLQGICETLDGTLAAATQGRLLRDGISVVIVGQPNVGKSTLLNALVGRDAAIVTDIAGTTRDLLHEQVNLDGVPLHLTDTAGLRESADVVEQAGVNRAKAAMTGATILLVVTDTRNAEPTLPADAPVAAIPRLVVRNKVDLWGEGPKAVGGHPPEVWLSAKCGAGLDRLKDELKRLAGYNQLAEAGAFMARRRHLDALEKARDALAVAAHHLEESVPPPELIAEELRLANQALGVITGEFTTDDLLTEIFSSFCIGK